MINQIKSNLIFIVGLLIAGTYNAYVPFLTDSPISESWVTAANHVKYLKNPLVWLDGNVVAIKCEQKRDDADSTTYSLTSGLKWGDQVILLNNLENSFLVVDSEKKKESPLVISIKLTRDSLGFYKFAVLESIYLDATKINNEEDLKNVLSRTLKAMVQLVQETTAGANKGLYNTLTGGWRTAGAINYAVWSLPVGLYQGVSDVAHAVYSARHDDPGVVSSQAMLEDILDSLKKNMPTGINPEKAKIIRDTVDSFIIKPA